jgi:cytochrome P450
VIDAALAACREQHEMMLPHVLAKRSGEGDDFISLVWRSGDELFDGDFDEYDVLTLAFSTFNAGAGSVGSTIANGIYLLASRSEVQKAIRDGGDAAVRNFVEETLRLYSTVEWGMRWAKQDTEVRGVPVKKGEPVIIVQAAANRDPGHYRCPFDVDLERRALRDHYGFMQGPRICPGQALARFQMERTFGVVLDRLDDLRLDPAAEQPVFTGALVRRWQPLNTLFAARG